MAKVRAFRVEFSIPPGASIGDAMAYIEAALYTEKGFRLPTDPMHNFDPLSLGIRLLPESTSA
jgi:hypothetical protein